MAHADRPPALLPRSPGYLQFGEHLPTYKPKPLPAEYADLRFSKAAGPSLMLNYLTPHGKWHIHSTYGDNQRMTTLSRGVEPFWMNDQRRRGDRHRRQRLGRGPQRQRRRGDARGGERAHSARASAFSTTRPSGPIRVPEVAAAGNRRAGGHNSLTRTRLKPNLMVGGYGQFTYPLQLLGTDRLQPRHPRARPQAARPEVVGEEAS